MRKVLSHPDKELQIHLEQVARHCAVQFQSAAGNCGLAPSTLYGLGYIAGAIHDIGKATGNFQVYVRSRGTIVNHPKHHSWISAFIAKFLARRFLQLEGVEAFDLKMLPYLVFISVKRHHGKLLDFQEEVECIGAKQPDMLFQLEDLWSQELLVIVNSLLASINVSLDWQEFAEYLRDFEQVMMEHSDFILDEYADVWEELESDSKVQYYYLHQALFSSLLYADKTDVILGGELSLSELDMNSIERFRILKQFDKPTTEINRLKNKAYKDVISGISANFDPKTHLYSLTLPTGMGKTITSLGAAMAIKQQLGESCRGIVVAIPFTSIIDQNFDVFGEIFDGPTSDVLMKHHHLAEPEYKVAEDSLVNPSIDQSRFLIETWNSQVVVTTFVQLLETMYSNDKGRLLKFSNLCNSVIILDEVQQVKYQLWPLIRASMQVLGEQFGIYFILMSATQPLIFDPASEISELVPEHQGYFQFFNRTKLINRTNEVIDLEGFCDTVADYHYQHSRKSILIILNTKAHTLECFQKLCELLPKSSAHLYFLSTLVTPFERKRIIAKIKEESDLPAVIVSTQLIEAGVDISVDTVFRNLAPIDCLIQAAGRANRYSEQDTISEVYIFRIKELEKATNLIYGVDLVQKSKNALSHFEELEERDYLELIARYFKEVRRQSDLSHSDELESMEKLAFQKVGEFRFIEQQEAESVFVSLNSEAESLWQTYLGIYEDDDLDKLERRRAFSLIKNRFYDYVINVPLQYGQQNINFDSEPQHHFYVSDLHEPSSFYHFHDHDYRRNWGYVSEDSGTIFL